MSSILNFTGLASGIDTGAIVSALVQAESAPVRRMENTQAQLQTKSDALEDIGDLLKQLKDAAEGLDETSEILPTTASVDQEDALSVTATGDAVPGIYRVTVTDVAQEQRNRSDGYSSKDTAGLLGTGTLTIQIGTDDPVDLAIDASTTLSSLAGAINASDADVTAGVVFDGTDYRMIVIGNQTGDVDGAVTFSGATLGLDANQYQAPEPATFEVEQLTMTSQSNVIEGAIPGATLTLRGETSGEASITLAQDSETMADRVEAFVSAYNSAMSKVDSEFTRTGTGDLTASLFGDSTLQSIKQNLNNAILDPVSGLAGDYTYAASIGLSFDRYGTLSLDRDTLEEAVGRDPTGVADLLRNDEAGGITGIMARVATAAELFTDPIDGILPARIDGIDDRVRGLSDQISRAQTRIDAYESKLTTEFALMEQLLSSLQAQGDQLSAMLAGLS